MAKSRTRHARDEALQPRAKTGRRARILVIEDEVRLLDLLAEILTRDGHTVWKASDGAEGLAIFEREIIDVVFTDLWIPKVSGWEVARAVKRKDPRVPIILVTGSLDQVDSRRLAENGVDLVVPKPFYVEDISSALASALGLRPVGRGSDLPLSESRRPAAPPLPRGTRDP